MSQPVQPRKGLRPSAWGRIAALVFIVVVVIAEQFCSTRQ
jgi:hypothetical protein